VKPGRLRSSPKEHADFTKSAGFMQFFAIKSDLLYIPPPVFSGGLNMDIERSWHEMTRGMKKAQVRALWEPAPMTDEQVRKALSQFSEGIRDMGFTGPGSAVEVYRDQRLHRELMGDDGPSGGTLKEF
jgi:hypothetical protein